MTKPAPPPWIHQPAGVLFGTRTKVAVLRDLCGAGAPLSQRELARRTHLTPRSIGVALGDLVATGIVHRHAGGREHMITLNDDHQLAPALRAWFAAETDYFLGLRRAVAAIGDTESDTGLVSVALFGSVARGEEAFSSDLDVLLLGQDKNAAERWRARYLAAAVDIQAQFGINLNPIAYSLTEARYRFARREPPFPEIVREASVLFGHPLPEALGS